MEGIMKENKRKPYVFIANILLVMIATVASIFMLVSVVTKQSLTNKLSEKIMDLVPIYSEDAPDSESISEKVYELVDSNLDAKLDTVLGEFASYVNVTLDDIEGFLKAGKFENVVKDILDTYIDDFYNKTNNSADTYKKILNFFNDNKKSLANHINVDNELIRDKVVDIIMEEVNSDNFFPDDDISINSFVDSKTLSMVSDYLATKMQLLFAGIVVITLLLLFTFNRKRIASLFINYGVLSLLVGIFMFAIHFIIDFAVNKILDGQNAEIDNILRTILEPLTSAFLLLGIVLSIVGFVQIILTAVLEKVFKSKQAAKEEITSNDLIDNDVNMN